MVLLGFTKLKDKLLDGSKTQTIRKPRKIPLKVGDKLYIYWKLRTKQCQKLGEAKVTDVVRKRFRDITEEDAIRDGLSTLQEFRQLFLKMHKDVLYTDTSGIIQEIYPYVGFDIITFKWIKKEA
jgi:hypothetical protein